MRQALLDCCALDWSRISPAIFGFAVPVHHGQAGTAQPRRTLHQRENIPADQAVWMACGKSLKKITNKNKLYEFHGQATLKFLDPACGCGNFLVIAYRELRLLELKCCAPRKTASSNRLMCIR
ncbi:MAG: DNA methyltransferase [Pseudomonadales bacterium]